MAILIGLGATYVAGDLVARLPLSAGMALPCLAFVAAGGAFRRVEPRIPALIPVALVLLVVSGALVWSGGLRR